MTTEIKLEGFLLTVDHNKVSIIHPSGRGCIVVFEENAGRLGQGYIGTLQWTLSDLSLSPVPTQFKDVINATW